MGIETKNGDLWNGTEIEVIGVSGEYQSGKTLFALTIDPGRTLYYDFEKSGATYAGLGIAKRIDVPSELHALHPKGYKPVDVFVWWREQIRNLKADQYLVIAVDPISDIEQGLVDWVRANPEHFGRTANQYEKASGLMWADVKSYWKMLLSDLASRCRTFVFTSHMRNVWKGSSPTGRREPKGKDTLMELSSLYLLLERKPDKNGKMAAKPAAVVLKSRLASVSTSADGEIEIIPTLPPRLPVATPAEIRKYISSPPDYKKLKPRELHVEPEMSEEDKLIIRRETAEAERDTEEAKLSRLDMMKTAATRTAAAKRKAAKDAATPDKSAAVAAEKSTRAKTAAAKAQDSPPFDEEPASEPKAEQDSNGKASTKLLTSIGKLRDDLAIPNETWDSILRKRGAEKLIDLSADDAEQLQKRLWDKLAQRDLQGELVGTVNGTGKN